MANITNRLILTAGPYITNEEGVYCLDAALNGWNYNWSSYIKAFEKKFAEYIGVEYSISTSSCTGALHLALLAMGVGPGDEVIMPETTWIATASAIKYVGATPVFVDIDPETWVLDSKKIEDSITDKTKVIIPVHLYGNPVDMDPIYKLKEKYGFYILEDAAPSIGTEYKGRKTGSLGDMAAFSFQGAKAFVTGEGGMLVSDNKELMDKAITYWDHGRDPENPLSAKAIGYKYKMSNIQAALGLAQIEKADEIVNTKRKLFRWYSERLSGLTCIKLNVEREWAKSLFWMTSIILTDEVKISRDDFIKELKKRNIDSRPIFSPISSFPIFNSQEKNINAYTVPLRGINLPSGHLLAEEEIDYICYHIRDILDQKLDNVEKKQPQGWLGFRDEIEQTIHDIKNGKGIEAIYFDGGSLVPFTINHLTDDNIEKLSQWREKAQQWFPSQFKITNKGTERWAQRLISNSPDRILFWVKNSKGQLIGHVGLFRFNYRNSFCEIDNIIRGVENTDKGIMLKSIDCMIDWAKSTFNLKDFYLRVVSDNQRAISLYERIGFDEIQRNPLIKKEKEDQVSWDSILNDPYFEVERYIVTMKLRRQ